MEFSNNVKEYAIKCHQDTNHLYDGYLPYQFHLNMVVANAHRFKHLIDFKDKGRPKYLQDIVEFEIIVSACWCHDLIEDCRQNYSDVLTCVSTPIKSEFYQSPDFIKEFSHQITDIVYAVSNEKGKNRSERENDKYFEGIKNTPYATFVKLCDRLANIQYSKMTAWKSDAKLEMYRKEDRRFVEQLYDEQYKEMFCYMRELFTEK